MTNASHPPSAVDELSERFWESILELNPVTATVYGDERYADRLDDPGPEGRAATRRLMERTLVDADAIPVDGLSTEDRITRDMLRVVAELGIEEDDQKIHELESMRQTLTDLVHRCHGDHRPECPILEDLAAERESEEAGQ